MRHLNDQIIELSMNFKDRKDNEFQNSTQIFMLEAIIEEVEKNMGVLGVQINKLEIDFEHMVGLLVLRGDGSQNRTLVEGVLEDETYVVQGVKDQ